MRSSSKRRSRKQKKDGVCIYYLTHRGLGKQVHETDDIKSTRKMLKNNSDNTNVSCARTKAKAKEKYLKSIKRSIQKRKRKKPVKN